MKKFLMLFLTFAMMAAMLSGCRMGSDPTDGTNATDPTNATQPSTQPTQPTQLPTDPTQTEPQLSGSATTTAAQLLNTIWTQYAQEDRFASYGGTVENSVADAPGDLDMQNTEELTSKYMLPQSVLEQVENGASLVHLMNNNIFTAAAFSLKEGTDVKTPAKALRDNLQKTQWICGQPDRLLIAEADGHLLMAFAAKEAMDTFRQNLQAAYQNVSILYDEAVTT